MTLTDRITNQRERVVNVLMMVSMQSLFESVPRKNDRADEILAESRVESLRTIRGALIGIAGELETIRRDVDAALGGDQDGES